MIAFAPPLSEPAALLAPLAPGAAYAADVVRLDGRAPIGPVDDAWLALAHALDRAAQLPAAERTAVLRAGADGVAGLLSNAAPESMRTALLAGIDGLRVLSTRLCADVPGIGRVEADGAAREAVDAAVGALQAVVAQAEEAGAFVLAFSTLAALRAAAAPVLDRRGEGLLLAQQGRVARQLGALATAAELYAASAQAGRAARAPDVVARALIGGGVLASMRGNYPEARRLFRRALTVATRAGHDEHRRAAHHGLLFAALAARDVETALIHGWAAFSAAAAAASDERAEMLLNLGDIGRQTGEFRAALGAALSAIELTDSPRVRLPALGCAVIAAAHLGEAKLCRFLVADVERVIRRSGQPWENARALADVAEAYSVIGAPESLAFAERAEAVAAAGKFHEVVARAELVKSAHRARAAFTNQRSRRPQNWSAKTRTVLATLERLANVENAISDIGATA